MNSNNRNVRLKQRVLLLIVMGRVEGLNKIKSLVISKIITSTQIFNSKIT